MNQSKDFGKNGTFIILLHLCFPAPCEVLVSCHATDLKYRVTKHNGCFLLIQVFALMLFVFLFDCKSFTLVIVAHSSLYYLRIMHSGLPGSLKKETFGPKLHLLQ